MRSCKTQFAKICLDFVASGRGVHAPGSARILTLSLPLQGLPTTRCSGHIFAVGFDGRVCARSDHVESSGRDSCPGHAALVGGWSSALLLVTFSCWRRVQSYLGGPTLLSLFLALVLGLSSIDRSVAGCRARLLRLVLLSAACDSSSWIARRPLSACLVSLVMPRYCHGHKLLFSCECNV